MKNPFPCEAKAIPCRVHSQVYWLCLSNEGVYTKEQITYAADAINNREALEERNAKLVKGMTKARLLAQCVDAQHDFWYFDALLAEEKD